MLTENITKVPFVDLHAQYLSVKEEIDTAIADVIAQTAFISGKFARKFEEEFAEWLGIPHCIGCANGTDALEILLQALGIGAGDEVLVPACTWISTAEVVSSAGARPVFVDMHPDYYTLNLEGIEELITPQTRAIIPVHLYGLAVDMDAVMELARKYELVVIEDCAQAHGATWKGKKVGTFGNAATFSFYPGKNLGAYGDAGCMVCGDAQLAKKARAIANHGQPQKHTHTMIGRNSRLDGLQGAILSAKLPYLDQWTELRQLHAQTYKQLLAELPLKLPTQPVDASHVYHLFVIQVENRDTVKQQLSERGIQTAIHYPAPLPFTQVYAPQHGDTQRFPYAFTAKDRILSVPMYPELTEEVIRHIKSQLADILS